MCPPWIHGREKIWEHFAEGEVHFFKGRRWNMSGGTQIYDISLDQPGGENANSVPKT